MQAEMSILKTMTNVEQTFSFYATSVSMLLVYY